MVALRMAVLALLAGIALTVSAGGCPKSSPSEGMDSKSAKIDFNRDVNAKVEGKVKVGPCGRPKSFVNADVKDCGKTRMAGSIFQILETVGRFGEIAKIVGNRYKPEVCCPPRPPSNTDTSAESICAQRTIRRKPGKSSGRRRCRPRRRVRNGSGESRYGSGSGSRYGSSESNYGSGASRYSSGSKSRHGSRSCGHHHSKKRNSESYDLSSNESGQNSYHNVDVAVYKDDNDGHNNKNCGRYIRKHKRRHGRKHGKRGGKRRRHGNKKHRPSSCGCRH